MKKITFLIVPMLLLGTLSASAEMNVGSGTSTSNSGKSTKTMYVAPNPGFIQMNDLTVQSVSSSGLPADIIAVKGALGGVEPQEGKIKPSCYRYSNEDDEHGSTSDCPPSVSSTYKIKVSAVTKLMLRDRTSANIASFGVGDKINVYGYYNSDGTIESYIVRNTSKPLVTEVVQLNNATLVSISGNTLAVVQSENNPCYYYMNGKTDKSRKCPMGNSDFSATVMKSVSTPSSLMPIWNNVRKYVVTVDSSTTILDRNRAVISLSQLKEGDTLNIYGETSDGQTISADIIRDINLPVVVSSPNTLSGTVTQVNTDGTFTMQTSEGKLVTVKNPITVGSTVKVQGIFDSVSNILSEITSIFFSGYVVSQ